MAKIESKEKKDIIRQYNNGMAVKKIAEEYNIPGSTIYRKLNKWGIEKRTGIKYLLGKLQNNIEREE